MSLADNSVEWDWSPSPTSSLVPSDFCGPGKVVASYRNLPPFFDEPRLIHLTGRIDLPGEMAAEPDQGLGAASGASLSIERAATKMLGEACERLAVAGDPGDIPHRLDNFGSRPAALDPELLAVGEVSGAESTSRRTDKIAWTSGFDRFGNVVSIPRQLVDVPYHYHPDEQLWRVPITTGAAAGPSLEFALYSGLCEVIERDAFMSAWLLQATPPAIDPHDLLARRKNSPEAELLERTLIATERYRLDARFYQIPTGFSLTTVMCHLWDDTGLGAPLVVSAKTSPEPVSAILGALEEAHQVRPWTRYLAGSWPCRTTSSPSNLRERAMLWFGDEPLERAREWIRSSEPAEIAALGMPTLRDLLVEISRQDATTYFVDLSPRLSVRSPAASEISVVKVIVPEFQPLYLTERLRDIAWARLATFPQRSGLVPGVAPSQVESIPHPFL